MDRAWDVVANWPKSDFEDEIDWFEEQDHDGTFFPTKGEIMGRKLYRNNHWTRSDNHEQALKQYLKQYQVRYNLAKVKFFEELLGGSLNGKKVLDYGGGAGFMSVLCAKKGANVTLVDAEENAIITGRLHARKEAVSEQIEFICSETFPQELKGKRFDIIIAKDICEHINNDKEFLYNLSICQSEGGELILSTQNSFSINYALEGLYHKWWCGEKTWRGWDSTHVRFYTAPALERLLRFAGYVPDKWRSIYIIPYNILSWFFLLKKKIVINNLDKFDFLFGWMFPFNRLGWNIIILAKRGKRK